MTSKDDDFLTGLILWRNDPDYAEEVREKAETGNIHAQYALGLMYAEGRGVKQDEIKAYLWLSRAADQGDQDAVTLRHVLLNQMDSEQIAAAERESRQGTSTVGV